MTNTIHSLLLIIVIAAVTMLLRFLPFIVFPSGRKTPKYITYLGQVLPCAIMGMLVVYCLKSVSLISFPFGLPELIPNILVVGLYVWKRNTLISIGAGTVCYMLLIQFIFA